MIMNFHIAADNMSFTCSYYSVVYTEEESTMGLMPNNQCRQTLSVFPIVIRYRYFSTADLKMKIVI